MSRSQRVAVGASADHADLQPDNVIRIVIDRRHVASIAACDALVAVLDRFSAVLRVRKRYFEAQDDRGIVSATQGIPFWEASAPAYQIRFPAGLVPRVCAALEKQGYECRVRDRRRLCNALHADALVTAKLNPAGRALVAAVEEHFQGQIEVRGRSQALAHCEALCRAYPRARILICAGTRRDVQDVARQLTQRLRKRVGYLVSDIYRPGKRITVSTSGQLGTWGAYKPHLVLLLDASATHSLAREGVYGIQARKIFAFTDPAAQHDRLTRRYLETMAGPIVVRRAAAPRARAILLRTPKHTIVVPGSELPLARKRALYWQNSERNAFIAKVASALALDDRDTLQHLGWPEGINLISTAERSAQCILVAESTEHGRALQELLPGWPLEHAVSGSQCAHEGLTKPTDKSMILPAIVTLTRAMESGICADVVVWASGGDFAPDPTGTSPSGVTEPILVDFQDGHHRIAARDTKTRRKEYRTMKLGPQGP